MARALARGLPCGSEAFYIVKAGDTFFSVARALGVSPGALAAQNPYADPSALTAGEVLCVPARVRAVFCRYGQTLYDLLARYDVSYQALVEANPGLADGRVVPGRRLFIPPRGSRGEITPNAYILQAGDTPESVGAALGMTPLALLRLNKNMTPGDFVPGRQIIVR